jgi:malonyl-CoA/methylmalonyl-CoA synthetase
MPLRSRESELAMTAVEHNLYSRFAEQFARRPEQPLLTTSDGASLSYRDVESLAGRLATALSERGARVGDRVSVQVEKSPESLALYLACLRAGFVFHPLNTAYKEAELEFFLGDAEPAVVVCAPAKLDRVRALAERAGASAVLTLDASGSGSLAEIAAAAASDFATVSRERADLAALLYSSGTTGTPKGIMLTHGNLVSNTEALVAAWGFSEADRLLHALPIYHVHGLFVAIGCALLSGASMRWLPRFDAAEVLRFLPECTVMMGVPTYYTRLLAEPGLDRDCAANMRLFVSGSAPLHTETFAAFESRTGHRILERYGMTETNMNTSNPLEGERRPGTVGPPLPGVEVRVCDDAGAILGAGEIGNLEVRGPNVFVGYWKQPDKTAEDIGADGWFKTGDQAVIDGDGYVAIVGRAKDMVITGGLNVYPKEVERVIDDLPGVRESAVIGVPHPDFGEAVVAVVVAAGAGAGDSATRVDEAHVIAACKDRIADFKVPKRVLVVGELPRNAMAKVQKSVLRETYQKLFAATA